jgi:hypothetical protein
MTAKCWRDANPDKTGNIRDYADVSQLVCLSNLENLNAHFINDQLEQSERLAKLNKIAIQQMKLLTEHAGIDRMGGGQTMSVKKVEDEGKKRLPRKGNGKETERRKY